MNYIKITLVGLIVMSLTACEGLFPCLEGNGDLTLETRAVSGFSGIYNATEFDIYIENGSQITLEVQADENLQQYIKTYVKDNSLIVEVDDNRCIESNLVRINITCPDLSRIVLAGSGDIYMNGFRTDYFTVVHSGSGYMNIADMVVANDMEITHSGSGHIDLEGKSLNAYYILSGSGNIKGDKFRVNECSITLTGSGNIWVNFITALTGIISGSGDVRYNGPANGVNIRETGSGRVFQD